MGTRNAKKNLLKNQNNPPRAKRRVASERDTFQDRTYEELLLGGDMPDSEEREWLLWYANASAPGYPGPDVRCLSTLAPDVVLTTSKRANGRGRR